MSTSFDFTDPDRFTAGTVGPPGARVFFLQAAEAGAVATLKLEKQQVAALAEYLAGMLADLPPIEGARDVPQGLLEPVHAQWVVGPLGVAYDENADRFVLIAEELAEEPTEEPGSVDQGAGGPSPGLVVGDDDAHTARFRLRREQVAAFVQHASELIESGRPTCSLCGRPMDPAGHACPRWN